MVILDTFWCLLLRIKTSTHTMLSSVAVKISAIEALILAKKLYNTEGKFNLLNLVVYEKCHVVESQSNLLKNWLDSIFFKEGI